MIYEHFNMRLHSDPYQRWGIRTGAGVLDAFTVGSIQNPKPGVKTNTLDIPGTSGAVDMTEDSGRVYFENKTVTVVLQGRADFYGMDEVEEFFSPYQGRLMDFTTDDFLSVEKFQVGRLSAEINKKQNRVTLTFNTEPYRYTETPCDLPLEVLRNYEVDKNSDEWIVSDAQYGNILYTDDNVTSFTFCVDAPGTRINRLKSVGVSSGFFALGILSVQGGTVRFNNFVGNNIWRESNTIAKIYPITGGTNPGRIHMVIDVDGSYYEWKTVNGVRRYLPAVRCEYILSDYLPTDADGELSDSVKHQFDANVIIRPEFSNLAASSYVIVDGVAVKREMIGSGYGTGNYLPKIVLPGIKANTVNKTAESVFCCVADSSVQTTSPIMAFRNAEVF